jgi:hypothetical protein
LTFNVIHGVISWKTALFRYKKKSFTLSDSVKVFKFVRLRSVRYCTKQVHINVGLKRQDANKTVTEVDVKCRNNMSAADRHIV